MTAAERQLDRTALLAVPGILVVLLLFIYPFLHGLVLSFEPKEGGGLANYLRFFSQPFLYNTIATTLWVAIPTTLVNVGLALPIAFGMRRNGAWQRVLTTILVLPITLGTVLIAEGLLTYLGPQGWVNRLLIESGLASSPIGSTRHSRAPRRRSAQVPDGSSCTSTCRSSRRGSRSPSASASSRLSRSSRPRYCWAPRPGRRGSSPSPLTPPPSRSTTIRWPRRSR